MILEIIGREAGEVEVDRACTFGKPTGKARSVGDELHVSGPGLGNVPVFNLSVADTTARVFEHRQHAEVILEIWRRLSRIVEVQRTSPDGAELRAEPTLRKGHRIPGGPVHLRERAVMERFDHFVAANRLGMPSIR